MKIIVQAHNTEFIFNDWVGYRTDLTPSFNGKDIFPHHMRISNVLSYSYDIEVGLICIDGNLKYYANPKSCLWTMHTTKDFKFLQEVYNKLYPEFITYENISLAKSRIDNLLLKYNKLGCFL